MTITVWKDSKLRCNPHAAYTAPDGTRHIRVPAELYENAVAPEPPVDYSELRYIRTETDSSPYVLYEERSQQQRNETRRVQLNAEALELLAETDWMVIRSIETGVPVPPEILKLREDARIAVVFPDKKTKEIVEKEPKQEQGPKPK